VPVPGQIVRFRERGNTWWTARLIGMIESVDGQFLTVRMLGMNLEFTGDRRRVNVDNVEVFEPESKA
jgi:hypothetical protein